MAILYVTSLSLGVCHESSSSFWLVVSTEPLPDPGDWPCCFLEEAADCSPTSCRVLSGVDLLCWLQLSWLSDDFKLGGVAVFRDSWERVSLTLRWWGQQVSTTLPVSLSSGRVGTLDRDGWQIVDSVAEDSIELFQHLGHLGIHHLLVMHRCNLDLDHLCTQILHLCSLRPHGLLLVVQFCRQIVNHLLGLSH